MDRGYSEPHFYGQPSERYSYLRGYVFSGQSRHLKYLLPCVVCPPKRRLPDDIIYLHFPLFTSFGSLHILLPSSSFFIRLSHRNFYRFFCAFTRNFQRFSLSRREGFISPPQIKIKTIPLVQKRIFGWWAQILAHWAHVPDVRSPQYKL